MNGEEFAKEMEALDRAADSQRGGPASKRLGDREKYRSGEYEAVVESGPLSRRAPLSPHESDSASSPPSSKRLPPLSQRAHNMLPRLKAGNDQNQSQIVLPPSPPPKPAWDQISQYDGLNNRPDLKDLPEWDGI